MSSAVGMHPGASTSKSHNYQHADTPGCIPTIDNSKVSIILSLLRMWVNLICM